MTIFKLSQGQLNRCQETVNMCFLIEKKSLTNFGQGLSLVGDHDVGFLFRFVVLLML